MSRLVTTSLEAAAPNGQPTKYPTYYRIVAIDGLSIFYREAGPKDGPKGNGKFTPARPADDKSGGTGKPAKHKPKKRN